MLRSFNNNYELLCYVGANSNREHPPGKPPGFGKNWSNARDLRWQMPRLPFLQWRSNTWPPSPSDQYTKILGCHFLINITVSAQKNCIKQVKKWVTPTEQRQNKWLYWALLWSKNALLYPKWPSTSERRRKWQQCVTKKLFCCLQIPEGTLLTIKCPAPGTHRVSNARGDRCSRLELTCILYNELYYIKPIKNWLEIPKTE